MRKHPLESYKGWWLGKLCRKARGGGDFKLVTAVLFHGPPSGVYGCAELRYDDGTGDNIAPVGSFRPRKTDVEVKPFGLDAFNP